MPNTKVKKKIKETFRITTTRPVAILMVVLAVFVFGMISYNRLSLNLMPDITYPSITVRTEYPGTAPEEIETIISRPLEQALGVVNNLVNISSISKAGFSDVILEFTWDADMNLATQDAREKIDQVFLPLEVKKPIILRYDPTLDPILRMGLYGDQDLFTMRRLADEDIKRELETVPGVAAVKVKGGLEEEIRVEINERQLAVLNIDINQVNQRLSQENVNLAGGNLKEGDTEYLVRTLNEFKTLDEINEIIIGTRGGADIRIKDIGRAFKTNKEREIMTRVNGVESVDIEIYKEADANIVTVAQMVKDRVFGTAGQKAFVENMKSGMGAPPRPDAIRRNTNFLAYSLPEGTDIEILSDQSIFIKNSLDEVTNTAIQGGILAIIVLFFFLRNVTSTFIIGLTIPVSIIATFAPMFLFDVSLNIMSLGGLALGVGMLVDNSIVVLESIFRCREEGDSIVEAAVRGTGEVGSAVIASTLTTIAVFFPIVFVEGVAGQIFGDMSLVVVFSLIASLLAALFFIPMLASRKINSGDSSSVIKQISSMNIVNFKSLQNVKKQVDKMSEAATLESALSLYGAILVNPIVAVFEQVIKVLKIFTTLLFVIAEFIMTLALGFSYAVVGTFIANKEKDFEKKSHILPDPFGKQIWNDITVFNAYNSIKKLMHGHSTWYHGKASLLGNLFALITVIFVIPYAGFRFLLEMFFGLIAKLIMLFIIFAFTMVVSLGSIFGFVVLAVFLPFLGLFNVVFGVINKIYPALVRAALHQKSVVIFVSAGSLALAIVYLLPQLGTELIPELHQGEFNVEFTYPVGTPLEKTSENILPIENQILALPNVKSINSITGAEKNSASSNAEEGEHTAKISVLLESTGDVIQQEEETMGRIRANLATLSGVTTNLARPALFSFKTPIEVEIRGFNLETLKNLSSQVVTKLSAIPGLTDVKSNIRRGNPEVQIKYDRTKIAKNNLNVFQVASLIKNKVQGAVATEFKDRERRIDILVRVREEDKANLQDLYRLVVNPGESKPIPLSAVASITISEGPSEIRRINQQRVALISANIDNVDLGTVTTLIENQLQTINMPNEFFATVTGQNEEMQTSLNSLQFAMILAIFLIYVVMASQFESLIHPFVILFTIPLAIIGVIVTLYALKISISVVVFIGMIMLTGIVVNNAIVLVDYINQLRKRGVEKFEAIITAGQVRLRPILMTTATTVLGLLPMALGLGEGAEIRTPMAITVIAGLISSTILTLIVIPTVYAVFDRKN